jgi:hypothetical protein
MSTNPPSMPPVPPPGGQIPAAPPKKGNFLVWVLVAVGTVFLVVCVAVIGGGLFIAHKVRQAGIEYSKDGKLTVKRDGKDSVVISSSGNGNDGSLEIKSADGTVKIGGGAAAGKVPAWIPDYPGSNTQGSFSAQTKEGSSGSFSFKTKDSIDKVVHYYEDGFKSTGLKVTSNITTTNGGVSGGVLSAEDDGKTHSSVVILGTEGGETTVNVTYNLKK